MQYRLTKPARQAVEYARNVAEELGHSYVGTEHLMIGLIRAYDGMASAILTQNGVSEDGLLPMIEQLISQEGTAVRDVADYTPRARRVIEMSSREAARMPASRQMPTIPVIIPAAAWESMGPEPLDRRARITARAPIKMERPVMDRATETIPRIMEAIASEAEPRPFRSVYECIGYSFPRTAGAFRSGFHHTGSG